MPVVGRIRGSAAIALMACGTAAAMFTPLVYGTALSLGDTQFQLPALIMTIRTQTNTTQW
jgi:hypothetical protein